MSAETVVVARVKSADVSRKGTGVQDDDVGSYRTLQKCGVVAGVLANVKADLRSEGTSRLPRVFACLERRTHPFPPTANTRELRDHRCESMSRGDVLVLIDIR
jgi:hypothetical protein